MAAAVRVIQIIDTKTTIVSPLQPTTLRDPVVGQVCFKGIEFSYATCRETQERPVLKQLDFTIEPRTTVAFVGPSGAGKSTLINLIPRFFDPTKGTIYLDGCDIKELALDDLRSQIALVSQEVALFDCSVADNIAYGIHGSRRSVSREEVEEAAKLAAAHDFITALPKGYDTMVGENGLRLSGGQRQRVAIARAIIKNAKVLLLDEATSALDSGSEKIVQYALTNLMNNRTTIIVAHRLSTIVHAKTIYVIDEGLIVESGNHQELMAQQGVYSYLWTQQIQV